MICQCGNNPSPYSETHQSDFAVRDRREEAQRAGVENIIIIPSLGVYTIICEPGDLCKDISGVPSSAELETLPTRFKLKQNFPNPFNPRTSVMFTLPEASDIVLEIFAINGRRVATLVEDRRDTGRRTVTFDASSLASGNYICRLQAGSFVQTRKLMLIR